MNKLVILLMGINFGMLFVSNRENINIMEKDLYEYGRTMWFGKYKGEYINYLCRYNPDYIWWCMNNVKGFQLTSDEKDNYSKGVGDKINRHYNKAWIDDFYDDESYYDSQDLYGD